MRSVMAEAARGTVLLRCRMRIAIGEPGGSKMNRLCVVLGGVVLGGMLMILAGLAVARQSLAEHVHGTPDAQVQFLGTWKLVSTEEKLKDGSSRPYQDVGPRGAGYLI